MDLSRRSLFAGLGALIAAPAIVRAASLMPVRTVNWGDTGTVWIDETGPITEDAWRNVNRPYLTVADGLRENGWRHMTRGYAHRAAGREEWAKGSFAKAQRNFERASLGDVNSLPPEMRASVQDFADRVANSIMSSGSESGGLAALLGE
jgi:hypothetical protein